MHTREILQLDTYSKHLLTSSRDGTCRLWRLGDADYNKGPQQTLRSPGRIQAVALLPLSNALAVATENKHLYIYNMEAATKDMKEYAQITDSTAPLLRT